LGRDDRGGLCHEMHPTEHDHISLGPRSSLGQSQRIANIVRDVLNLRDLIVVREYDGVPLTLEPRDLR